MSFASKISIVDCRDMKRPSTRVHAKARQLMTRPPLDRMQQIFQVIKAGKYPTRQTLSTEIEVTTKTIQRDLDFMRDRFKLPIAFDNKNHGYRFTQPVENFPMVELTEAEIVSVFIAQKAMKQYRGTSFEQPLRSAFDKLLPNLNGKIVLSWDELDSFISFRGVEVAVADLQNFQAVSDAVRKSVALEFDYKKLNATAFEKRKVEPYHLACVQGQWYCFAFDVTRRAMRSFVLTRMRHAVSTNQVFTKSKKFSLKTLLKDSFGVFCAKGQHSIHIRFDRFAAQLVRERIWHSSQQIQELTGDEIEFRATVSSLHEIERWVLSWGTHATVLRPRELVDRIREVAKAWGSIYP